jgi:hypothetical protein
LTKQAVQFNPSCSVISINRSVNPIDSIYNTGTVNAEPNVQMFTSEAVGAKTVTTLAQSNLPWPLREWLLQRQSAN